MDNALSLCGKVADRLIFHTITKLRKEAAVVQDMQSLSDLPILFLFVEASPAHCLVAVSCLIFQHHVVM